MAGSLLSLCSYINIISYRPIRAQRIHSAAIKTHIVLHKSTLDPERPFVLICVLQGCDVTVNCYLEAHHFHSPLKLQQC